MQNILLLGSNISHSWSPRIHNYLFERFALPYRYELHPLDASEVPAALQELKSGAYRGANVTSPHKEVLFDLLDERSIVAERIGAVNTIVIENGKAIGHNTDTDGFRWSLRDESLLRSPFTAAVLGSGGGARAALDVLLEFDTLQEISLYSRSPDKAAAVCTRWTDKRLMSGTLDTFHPPDLLVHATPLGLPGNDARLLEPEQLRGVSLLYEMIYHPSVTRLMQAAVVAGVRAVGGKEMFIGQALAAFALWTGITVDADELPRELLGAMSDEL